VGLRVRLLQELQNEDPRSVPKRLVSGWLQTNRQAMEAVQGQIAMAYTGQHGFGTILQRGSRWFIRYSNGQEIGPFATRADALREMLRSMQLSDFGKVD